MRNEETYFSIPRLINRRKMIFNKRGQLTIIIIVAVLIAVAIGIYFLVRNGIPGSGGVPVEFAPVFQSYSDCIRMKAEDAIALAESQGGRVYVENYEPGSDYAPFSSQLNFMGNPVPYWYYLSGNGVIREQVPSKSAMEGEIGRYVRENIKNCNYNNLYSKGFSINFGTPQVSVSSSESAVTVNVNSQVSAELENSSATKSTYNIVIASKLGKFYRIASEIYNTEKQDAVLENYAVDALNNYAPVDGVELSCAPRIWKTREVSDGLKQALTANIGTLKVQGNYYSLKNKQNQYFVINYATDEAVNFMYSPDWPTRIEISGTNGELMIAEPVGNREGMGVMGFCYAPYHFVYDMSFPVMVQIYDSNEIFEFPVVVVVDKNMPRNSLPGDTLVLDQTPDVCGIKSQDIAVTVRDNNLNPVNANLSYTCFDSECILGETSGGSFVGKAPACVNGYLKASAGGYADKKILVSTNSESRAEIFMDREYDVNLSLSVGGAAMKGYAIVSFSGDRSVTTALPDSPGVKISEGLYNVSVYVYGNSSITIPANTKTQCQQIAQGGLLGVFGGTEEKCFKITLPETKVDQALIGGGTGQIYLLPSDLDSGKLTLRVDALPYPSSLDQLAENYNRFDLQGVNVG